MNPIISLKNVTKKFSNHVVALKDLSLFINQGEVFGLLGPNGSGKTTTLNILAGITKATTGRIKIQEQTPEEIQGKKKRGYMPELPFFPDYLTGYEFLSYIYNLYNLDAKRKKDFLEEICEKYTITHYAHKKLANYSKGMLQKINLIQAIMHAPEILFLDEPFASLDPLERKSIRDILLSLKRQGKTIIISSHLLEEIAPLCDRVGIIYNGQIAFLSSIAEIQKETSLEKIFIETCKSA